MDGRKILMIYLISINILTFLIFGWDKMQARRNRWRIAERTLFLSVILGGGLGGIAGMKVWRHKTRKGVFRYGIPTIVSLQGAAALYITFFME
ncbi:hypothetical protein PM10SUCC1_11510 [Propionigenium maris DSM 9537]|uniref:DUF1294 domain-containing protein n=1 Tax=Propionigenium maris DSM 9537 TaxID=1123000 RepID=A0A9W6LMH2_9FUSO|nr:DUF1294 domain-containing protein [Propionigenium maris]GLI55637.1 hypothetical protein PM10SUCC1_11510 [Propionigenium maris DSM 9537]